MNRRTFIKSIVATAAIGAAGPLMEFNSTGLKHVAAAGSMEKGIQVPYSTGRSNPTIKIPEDACDCHHHIYDPARFAYLPTDTRNQPPATVDLYRMLQRRLGLTRNVIIQPSAYGIDNSCTLDALKQMGKNARAIVVVDETITDSNLDKMNKLGVRGVRFNVSKEDELNRDTILKVSQKIKKFGWHVQFWMPADTIVKIEDTLLQLPTPIVFDHRGHLPKKDGISHPAFQVISKLLDKGNTWVKLSAPYHDSNSENNYADTIKVGKAYVDYAPERMLWGTDWPHPSEFSARKPSPDDALMLDLLAQQAPDENVRKKILVDNPAKLFGF